MFHLIGHFRHNNEKITTACNQMAYSDGEEPRRAILSAEKQPLIFGYIRSLAAASAKMGDDRMSCRSYE